jgi:hypothetical protein
VLLEPTARMYFLAHAIPASLDRALARRPEVLLLNAYTIPAACRDLHRVARPRLGAANGARTRDPQLGKLMLYQLSYRRVRRSVPASDYPWARP